MSKLFQKFEVRNTSIKNRIVMAPMCMYSADNDGTANDWHFIHYASRAVGGCGLIIVEATAVESSGRISDRDLGIWKDEHIEGLSKIVSYIRMNGAVPAIQLNHSGRKSTVFSEPVYGPSELAFSDEYKTPTAMTFEDIKRTVNSFKKAAERALKAGFEVIEIHGAHGYLINQFLSPLTNKREDIYGGSLENRARFLGEVIGAVREVWSEERPIILRVSAEEYAEDGNHPEDLAYMINLVKELGVDIVNVSSGGVIEARVNAYPGYQVEFAEKIQRIVNIPVIAGGLITTAAEAEEILASGKADMVFLGRVLLRSPYWPLIAAKELSVSIDWPRQYERGR